MSMTGGISFYERNKALAADGATAAASSNNADAALALGTNKYFKWQSIGSNDATTETLTITLAAPVSISRIFLLDHNLKKFQIQYDNGTPADFANVVGLDSYTDNEIDVTGFARNTAYFQFTPVTTDTLILTMDTTQTVNAQKFLGQFIATNEIGTLEGYPNLGNVSLDRSLQREKAISGRSHVQKGYEAASFDLTLRTYPKQNDVDLLDGLHDQEDSFLVWLCGGLPDQFRIEQRGFKVNDLYNMQIDAPMRNSYDKNIYLMGVNQSYGFTEVV